MERFENNESIEKIKPKGIIAGNPGIGKTNFTEKFASKLKVKDLDSSDYRDEPAWPDNYIDDIIENTDKYDLLLIASTPIIVQALRERGFEVTVVCADGSLREEYIRRFEEREQQNVRPEQLADWGIRSKEENLRNFAGGRIIFLQDKAQYLEHIFDMEDYE